MLKPVVVKNIMKGWMAVGVFALSNFAFGTEVVTFLKSTRALGRLVGDQSHWNLIRHSLRCSDA